MALVVTRDGFPLAHRTFAGNTRDLKTVQSIRQGKAQETRQDPRASRAFEGPFPQGSSFPEGQRDNNETTQTRMVVGWKTLDHLAKRAGLVTEIRKPDPRRPRSSPKPRRMTPQVILRELGRVKIGDILMKTTDGRELALRRVARPDPEQTRILEALKLTMPERLATPNRVL